MARHPDVSLTKRKFEQALMDIGCHANFADAAASDFSVLMPLLIHALGKERFFEIVEAARPEVYLQPAHEA